MTTALLTTPTQSNNNKTVSFCANTSYLNATTRTTGGDTFTIAKPGSTNAIICFNGKPEINAVVYDAQFVFNSLAAKYGIVGGSN